MIRVAFLLLVALLGGVDRLAAQHIEVRGMTTAIKLEEVIYGQIPELNGKYKMRATEVTFAPDAFLRRASPRRR